MNTPMFDSGRDVAEVIAGLNRLVHLRCSLSGEWCIDCQNLLDAVRLIASNPPK